MKQTAVEWLVNEIQTKHDKSFIEFYGLEIIQAKAMEKQQIIDAFDEGQEYEYLYHINNAPKFYSKEYYNETFNK